MRKNNPLYIVLLLSFFVAACNPQDPSLDETPDQTEQEQEEVKIDPSLPEDPGADEVIGEETPEDQEQVSYSVQLTFNKNAYGFYADETQVVSGTVSSTAAKEVQVTIDGRVEKVSTVSSKKFNMSLTFYDAAMGDLTFHALDANGNVVGKKTLFYQVVRRPVDGGVVTNPSEDKRFQFNLSAPNLTGARKMNLWATSYWLPQVDNKDSGFALRDLSGNSLGATVTRREWCDAAMEGSIQIRYEDGHLVTYNYAGTSSSYQVDCSAYYNHSPSHKVKFREANGEFGDGVRNYELVPHRSIAVDPNVIPYGSVVYIPSAKGNVLKLPNGKSFVHDGYYYAVDTGGLIKQNHIDVFRGTDTKITQSWIKSSSSGTFTAYIVDDTSINNFLDEIH